VTPEERSRAELEFWVGIRDHYYRKGYLDFRRLDLEWYSAGFGGNMSLKGKGLEIGTGMYSMLEFSDATDVVSIDPLQDEFRKLFNYGAWSKILYLNASGEDIPFPDSSFDWITCWNTIDHCENPDRMGSEMRRVLRSGGKVYLEVNFDQVLTPEHKALWTLDDVTRVAGDLKIAFLGYIRNEAMKRTSCFVILSKDIT
jgi:ubiquinone/menaquinone biosynthesis C-methylase UbiE